MKEYKAILFDLDGTLLPMDMDVFMKAYFKELCVSLAKYGVPAEKLVQCVWAGTKSMVKNDGSVTNDKRFWDTFLSLTGIVSDTILDETEYFYSHEFNRARHATGENLLARETVEAARGKGRKVVLATNPLFPMAAQISRISWIGLAPDDFDLITAYETDSYCKPNPAYYAEICARIGVSPDECLMIGNDVGEDMLAAMAAGIDGYLITDCMILAETEWTGPSGTYLDMLEMLKIL